MTQSLLDVADVNETFRQEKVDQREAFAKRVEAGEIVKQSDGRYRVMVGWDAGEYLNDQLEPITGLDLSLGTAALYSSVPAWHGLGNVVPGGTTSIDDVLRLGGIAFDVVKRPVRFDRWEHDEVTDRAIPLPLGTYEDSFVTVRTDTQNALGVVGRVYEPLQNRESFEFLEDLTSRHGMVWESAGALRDGSKTFVSTRLPDDIVIETLDGHLDRIVLFLVALNSHDGSTKFECVATPWRPVCGNTERFALRDAKSRWGIRHTKTARDRMDEARKTLRLTMKYAEKFAEEEQLLAREAFTMAEFMRLTEELWPAPDSESKAAVTRWEKKQSDLRSTWRRNAEDLGETRYAAERAVTQWLDNEQTVRAGSIRGSGAAVRATRVIEGADDDRKAKAHKLLLTVR